MNVDSAAIGTEITVAIPQGDKLPVFFSTPAMVDALLDEIDAKAAAFVHDLSTKTSRARTASAAMDIAKQKVAMDKAGLSLTEGMRETIDIVNAERAKIRTRLDLAKARLREPLTKYEIAEEARINAIQDRLAALDAGRADALCPSTQIAMVIGDIEQIEIDATWQEFTAEAGIRKNSAINQLRAALAAAQKREADEAELARLRREAAEREQAEAQAAVERAQEEKRLADEKAAQEAREQAAREAVAERDRQHEQFLKQAEREAADRLAAAQEAAAARQRQTERDAAELVANAEREKQAEIDKAVKLAREQAAQEQARKAEADRAARVKAAREADEKHRAKVRTEIVEVAESLILLSTMESGIANVTVDITAAAERIADALIAGDFPRVTVEF